MAAGAAGCGDGGSIEAGTSTVPAGTTVSARVYLADTAAAVASVADFSAVLSPLAPTLHKAALRDAAPELEAARDRAALLAGRLAAERLDDRRLEQQRAEASTALAAAVAAMDQITAAADAGDVAAAVAGSRAFSRAVGELRSLPAPQ
ncbi:MAG TPA: hypothetical protein VL422_06415 [Miltoncostaea sp.]|nr:hypothetical protein [Miltoncostaea sp.]